MCKNCYKLIAGLFLFCVLSSGVALFAKPYKSNVVVSYYAEDFHGKKTSNGEKFNMYALTCAHKSLPFNTILKVTNSANGKAVQVRVNDRGPFVYDREVDLSKAAAIKLDMIKSGTALCDIEIVNMGPDTKLSRDTAAKVDDIMKARGETGPEKNSDIVVVSHNDSNDSSNSSDLNNKIVNSTVKQAAPSKNQDFKVGTLWDIQLGSFSKRENANSFAQQLLRQGFENVVFQKTPDVYRVVIRCVPGEHVIDFTKKLNSFGYENILIRQRLSK